MGANKKSVTQFPFSTVSPKILNNTVLNVQWVSPQECCQKPFLDFDLKRSKVEISEEVNSENC
jgi:hypothetical protein